MSNLAKLEEISADLLKMAESAGNITISDGTIGKAKFEMAKRDWESIEMFTKHTLTVLKTVGGLLESIEQGLCVVHCRKDRFGKDYKAVQSEIMKMLRYVRTIFDD